MYLGVEFSLGTILTNDEGLWFIGCTTGFRELTNFNLVCITLFRADVNAERRFGDVLVVELDTDTIFTWENRNGTI
jgi:hypothetical protein